MSNLKSYIDNQLSNITISDKLTNNIMNATTLKCKQIRNPYFVRRCVAFALIICLLLTCSVTTLAATVPTINNWVYSINPELAELLYPINKSVEDNGIKVEVLDAINDNYNAVVYFTVQDITGENRVDETLDLCDTSVIDGPFSFNVELLSYNEESDIALFVMRGSGGEGMSNQMTAFKISMLMSNKKKYEWYNTELDIANLIDLNAKSISMSNFTFTGGSVNSGKDLFVLEPDVMEISLGNDVDFVTITNIGFVDGKLHIQTKWEVSFDNHGDFRLVDKNKVMSDKGNDLSYKAYYFRTDSDIVDGNFNSKHIEYVFDVGSIDKLSQYNLWATLIKDGDFIDGNWKVNFRLEG